MKLKKPISHAILVTALLFILALLPIMRNFDIFGQEDSADAASSATLELPDQPSGEFIVVINTNRHPDTANEWKSFFSDEDFPVIFEDISCLTAAGDVGGIQLAERFRLQLPENQMRLRTENAELLASKTESGYIDVAVFSAEMAEHLGLHPADDSLMVIKVSGGEE